MFKENLKDFTIREALNIDAYETDQILSDLDHRRQLERRKGYAHHARKLSDVLSEVIHRRGYARVLGNEVLRDAWETAVGQNMANQTEVGNVRRGTLQVTVANSVVMQELTFQKSTILPKLKELAPHAKIRSLRFRVGTVTS